MKLKTERREKVKKQSYFSHDSNARNSDKLIPLRMRHGVEGYGIYFMILERLREESDYSSIKDYNTLAFDFRVGADKVKSVVEDFGLFSFTENGERFYSESFTKRMVMKDAATEKLKEAGRAGAEKRWGSDSHPNGHPNGHPNSLATEKNRVGVASKEKGSKEKKREESPPTPPLGECVGADLDFANDCVPEKEPPAKEPSLQEQRFAVFWQAYPKKRGIGEAEKAFRKIKPSQELLEKMLIAIEKAKWSDDWTRENKRFVPNPTTWLNQRRWDDEPPPPPTGQNRSQNTGQTMTNITPDKKYF